MKAISRRIKLNTLIFRVIDALLTLNTRVYGAGATNEVLRDLMGTPVEYPETRTWL